MKKLFALILAGALAASSLTACGSTAVVAVPQPEATTPPPRNRPGNPPRNPPAPRSRPAFTWAPIFRAAKAPPPKKRAWPRPTWNW